MQQNRAVLTAVILTGSLGLGVQAGWTQDPGGRPPGQTIPEKIEPKASEPKGGSAAPKAGQSADPKAGQTAGMRTEDIKKVEEALKAKGHDPGPVDGVMDSKTQAALRAFQKANNLAETGVLDSQTAAKLGVQVGTGASTSPSESTPGTKGAPGGSSTAPGSGPGGSGLGGGSGPGSSAPRGGETGSGSPGTSPSK
jgi:peptidoglycan hydrolase-like protein with peptidoglycan-binding domain